jgi:hypothetical protein
MMRNWINLIESAGNAMSEGEVVSLGGRRPEPVNMTPDVVVGEYTIHPVKKSSESTRFLDYWVWIEGPGRDPEEQIDIRRYASGKEPEKVLGLPDLMGSREEMTKQFTNFKKRADTLRDVYGQEKPPEVRFNPDWVLWRKQAILNMAKRFGLEG